MKVTYGLERFASFYAEAEQLLKGHWVEVALDHAVVPYDPNVPEYLYLESVGSLQVLVARCAGQIIGYHLSIIKPHLHYRTVLHAFTDVFYIDPGHRMGLTGYQLFREAAAAWGRRGVRKAYSGTKLHDSPVTGKSLNISRLLARLGWRENEHTFTLLIGETHGNQ